MLTANPDTSTGGYSQVSCGLTASTRGYELETGAPGFPWPLSLTQKVAVPPSDVAVCPLFTHMFCAMVIIPEEVK